MEKPMIPEAECQQRIRSLAMRLSNEGIDGALIVYGVDLYYYSGTRQNALLWVPADGAPVLMVRKSFARAARESFVSDIRPLTSSKEIPLTLGKARKIGITFDVLPAQLFHFYSGLLPGSEFADISGINRELRSVKSAWELEQMRISGRKLCEVFSQIPSFLSPGMREVDISSELEYRLRKAGAPGLLRMRAFNQEVVGIAVGESAAIPGCFDGPVTGKGVSDATPFGSSLEVIRKNVPIMIDYGALFDGYLVDMTRTFVIGTLAEELRKAFYIALDIEKWLIENMRPGRICEELYAGALRIAESAGLGEYFMGYHGEQAKFVGHGVGLELDELPVLAPKFRYPLEEGNVIAIEPKFLFPGRGIVGIENTYAVGKGGCEKLTDLPDNMVHV
jgi:Xaa-Pro aminopeptidase